MGHDIVSLSEHILLQKHLNVQWMCRVFNAQERECILNSAYPEHTLWAFWAAKESAYKAYIKKHPIRFFAPKKIRIHTPIEFDHRGNLQTHIQIKGEFFYTEIWSCMDFIFAWSSKSNKSDCLHWGVQKIPFSERAEVSTRMRDALRKHLSTFEFIKTNNITFTKSDNGVPEVMVSGDNTKFNVSFSHDFQYVSYIFFKEK